MREDAGEVNQLVKQAEDALHLRTSSSAEDGASLGILADERLLQDERLDDQHAVLFQQSADFIANRREGSLDEVILRVRLMLRSWAP